MASHLSGHFVQEAHQGNRNPLLQIQQMRLQIPEGIRIVIWVVNSLYYTFPRWKKYVIALRIHGYEIVTVKYENTSRN